MRMLLRESYVRMRESESSNLGKIKVDRLDEIYILLVVVQDSSVFEAESVHVSANSSRRAKGESDSV